MAILKKNGTELAAVSAYTEGVDDGHPWTIETCASIRSNGWVLLKSRSGTTGRWGSWKRFARFNTELSTAQVEALVRNRLVRLGYTCR